MSAVAHSTSAVASIEDRALELLGMGVEPTQVANALQVSPGRISQLLGDESFTKRLGEAKYKALIKHNETDNILDNIEIKLAKKLEQTIPMMMRPGEIVGALHKVNSMKRRGHMSPDSVTRSKPVVRLTVPIAVVNRFQLNAAGQVISAGVASQDGNGASQDLVTIQSGNMQSLVTEHMKALTHEPSQTLKESDGVRFRKAQGREFHDVMEECGFSTEIEVELPSSSQ